MKIKKDNTRPDKIKGVLVRIDTDDRTIFDFLEGYRLDTIPEDYELIKPHNARADDCEWEGYMRTSGEMFDISDSEAEDYEWAWVSNKVNLTQKEYDLLNKCGVV